MNIGSLTIPSAWAASLLALILAALLNRIFTGKKIGEWYWNSFFFYFFIWKTSYIFFQFTLFLNMPLSIIYFNGGIKGHILALVVLILYLFFIFRKKYPSIHEESIRIFLFYFIIYQVVINLIENNRIEMFIHSILLFCCLFLIKKISNQLFFLFLLLELLILSYFSSLFSIEGTTFSTIGLIMLILSKNKYRRRKT